MAKAPDPKKVAAELKSAEARKAREGLVMWVYLHGERRVLRWLDVSARQEMQLRQTTGITHTALWQDLLSGGCPMSSVLAAWWLAGVIAGVEGEDFDASLDTTYEADPALYYPEADEIAADGAEDGDDGPPA